MSNSTEESNGPSKMAEEERKGGRDKADGDGRC